MLQRFKDYIAKEHLLAEGQQVLLAVSGGRDSVTLCELMARAGYQFSVAHCNFNLRPGDCDRDEAFVRQLASHYNAICYVANFDTLDFARRERLSVEEAARKLRYDYFEEVRSSHNLQAIATAHHRDDAIETFFINLLRGTGITGLHGILPKNGNIIRPMLPFGRDEIDCFVSANGLSFVEDYTNAEPIYLRNKIRLQLVPLLRQLSPSFDTTMQANMERLADAGSVYASAVESVRNRLLRPYESGFSVDIKALNELTPLRTWLFEILRPFGFSSTVTGEVVAALNGQSGRQFFSATHRIVKDRDQLLVLPLGDDDAAFGTVQISTDDLIDGTFVVGNAVEGKNILLEVMGLSDILVAGMKASAPDTAWFDMDALKFPLAIRNWRNGDRFRPFGMKGSRLVSDLLSDHKLSLHDKEKVRLLCDADDTILWVIGLRASAVAPVSAKTSKPLKVKIKE